MTMNTKQKLSIGFLFLGFIFSSMVRVRFNISNGFDFHSFWIKIIPTPIFDFAIYSSNGLYLTTTIFGYLFFVAFGFFMINELKSLKVKSKSPMLFLLFTLCAILFEFTTIIQDVYSSYNGQHLRIGPALLIFGLLIFIKNNRTINGVFNKP
jgi:hypothetical protein